MVFIRKGNVIQTSNQISDGVITTNKLADNAVTSVKIADNAVSLTKIADNSINSNKIVDASIANADIANNTISAGKFVTDSLVKFVTYSGAPGLGGVQILSGYSSPTGIAKVIFCSRAEHSNNQTVDIGVQVLDSGSNVLVDKSATYYGGGSLANGLTVFANLYYTSSAPTMSFSVRASSGITINAYLLIINK